MQIGIIGSGKANEKSIQVAREVGREIAARGGILICGGLGGVMEAACEGAREKGGITVGILPTARKEDANRFVQIRIPTDIGWARNQIVVLASDALIVLEGECGTLSEMCMAWVNEKPIIAIAGTGGFADEFGGKKLDSKHEKKIEKADNAKEAVELAIKLYEENKG